VLQTLRSTDDSHYPCRVVLLKEVSLLFIRLIAWTCVPRRQLLFVRQPLYKLLCPVQVVPGAISALRESY